MDIPTRTLSIPTLKERDSLTTMSATTTTTTTKKVQIKLDNLTANNLGIFNRITSPTEYPDSYLQQRKDSGELCKYAFFSEVPVGVIVTEPIVNKSPIALKVSLLKVLDAYSWKFDIEKELLQYAVDLCPKRHLSSCVILVNKNDLKLLELAQELGFSAENVNKDLQTALAVAAEDKETVVLCKSV